MAPELKAVSSQRSVATQFKWNAKKCEGNVLHFAVLSNDYDTAARLLEEDSSLATQRFTYPHGAGEPIHIAASRSYMNLVELLLAKKASTDANVLFDDAPQYTVLHAAIFAEGRGASMNMVQYLLEAKCQLAPNNRGDDPIDLAWRTGNIDMIKLMTEETRKRGLPINGEKKGAARLKDGIKSGKLKGSDLVANAELSSQSIQVFVQQAPDCVPEFVERMKDSWSSSAETEMAKQIARELTLDDMCLLIKLNEPAVQLLKFMSLTPRASEPSWHPLPFQLDFTPRSSWETLCKTLNPCSYNGLMTAQTETDWAYDVNQQTFPQWHSQFPPAKPGTQNKAAHFTVCYFPNLVSPTVCIALADMGDDADLAIFKSEEIQNVISHVFWTGACRADSVKFMLSAWTLLLILVSSGILYARIGDVDQAEHDRETENIGRVVFMPHFMETGQRHHRGFVCASWMVSRACVDVIMECFQLAGCIAMSRPRVYVNVDNLVDFVKVALPLSFFFYDLLTPTHRRFVEMACILLSWARLMEFMTLSEELATNLLPIKGLSGALGPASLYATIGFCAFTHAFFVLSDGTEAVWPGLIYTAFKWLITAGLPDDPGEDSSDNLLRMIAVLFFTVLIMNIFIGVICDKYSQKKVVAGEALWHARASNSATYLQTARCLPCALMSSYRATICCLVAMVVCFTVQTACLCLSAEMPGTFGVFFFCQLVMTLSSYQDPSAPWAQKYEAWSGHTEQPYYLWTAHLHHEHHEENEATELKQVCESMQRLREKVEEEFSVIEDKLSKASALTMT